MYVQKCVRIIRLIPVNVISILSLIAFLWLILKWYFPPPTTFWYFTSKHQSIPLNRKLTSESKLAFLKNCSLIVTACTRNVEHNLPVFREKIESIVSLFGDYHIFVGESDSFDKTLILLRQWSEKTDHITIKTYGNLSQTIASRTKRIAYCRNDLLDEIRKNTRFRLSNSTFYMVVDADRNTQMDRSNFLSNFDYSIDEWGAMTASQRTIYYDIWALRSDIVNYDCWQRAKNFLVILITLNQAVERYIRVHQKPIPFNHSLIPVYSAFCGAAIYQMKYFRECRYYGYQSHEICEHVSFNLCVTRNGGKIYINPQFQID